MSETASPCPADATATVAPPLAPGADAIVTVRPDAAVATRQQLPYFVGICGATAGTRGLAMHLVVIPPGAASTPHVHRGYETAIYLLSGQVETRYGARLEHSVVHVAGDFVYIPADVPHQAVNRSATEEARALVARNDPNDRERVEPYAPPDAPQA